MKPIALTAVLVIVLCCALAFAQPATETPAAKTIADLKRANAELVEENARLKNELAALKAEIAKLKPAPANEIKRGMGKGQAEATMRAKGWKLRLERVSERTAQPDVRNVNPAFGLPPDPQPFSITVQVWQKEEGGFVLDREIDYAANETVEKWVDTKTAKRPR